MSSKSMSSEAAWGWLIVWVLIIGAAIKWWEIVLPVVGSILAIFIVLGLAMKSKKSTPKPAVKKAQPLPTLSSSGVASAALPARRI